MTYKESEETGNILANNYYEDKTDIIRAKSDEDNNSAIAGRAEHLLEFMWATALVLAFAPYAVLSVLALNGAMTLKAIAITALATFAAMLYMKPHMQRWYWWRVSWLRLADNSYKPYRPWERLRSKRSRRRQDQRQNLAPSRPGSPLEWLD